MKKNYHHTKKSADFEMDLTARSETLDNVKSFLNFIFYYFFNVTIIATNFSELAEEGIKEGS